MGEDIAETLEDPVCAKEWKAIGVQREDANFLFRLLDVNETSSVPFDEFLGGALRLTGPAKSIDILTIMQEARRTKECIEKLGQEHRSYLEDIHHAVARTEANLNQFRPGVKSDGNEVSRVSEGMIQCLAGIEASVSSVARTLKHIDGLDFE